MKNFQFFIMCLLSLGFSGHSLLTMPNVIRIVTRSMMISQYVSFRAADGFEPVSRAKMLRVLKVG